MKKSAHTSIQISIAKQQLKLKRGGATLRTFPVSTSRFGIGTEEGSFKTPTGRFRLVEKIGDGQPLNVAYKARVPVRASAEEMASDDLVMSRILWLDGLEKKNSNTRSRFIYIHGTNHEEEIGQPASHGCVRMRNEDVAELFELVDVGTDVSIVQRARRKRAAKTRRKALRRGAEPPK